MKRRIFPLLAGVLLTSFVYTLVMTGVARSDARTNTVISATGQTTVRLALRKVSNTPRFVQKNQPTLSAPKQKLAALPAPTNGAASVSVNTTAIQNNTTPAREVRRIIIPRMGVDSSILDGDVSTLNKGIWHIPGTSIPPDGGNVVISAHRYKWLPPSTKTFWNIDKMKVGDRIEIVWGQEHYVYQVSKTSIVTPDRTEILNNTDTPKLTLFSCTPKFTSKYRLVVEASLLEKSV